MIQKASERELIEAMYIYRLCVYDMNDRGLFNWNTAYPSAKGILEDIKNERLFLYKENHVSLGVFCMDEEQPEEYQNVSWKSDQPYIVVHRLAVHPFFRNRKIGEKIMNFVHQRARKLEYSSIRLDVITTNPAAVRLYRKMGYEPREHVHLNYQQDRFLCMEYDL